MRDPASQTRRKFNPTPGATLGTLLPRRRSYKTSVIMRKYRFRIAWYLTLLLVAGLALLLLRFPIAPAFLMALSGYFLLYMTAAAFNTVTSYEFWSDRTLGFPTKRVVQAMVAAGVIGAIIGTLADSKALTEISIALILVGIDGLITEHEKMVNRSESP